MKQIVLFVIALVILAGNTSCSAQDKKKETRQKGSSSIVEVYYFHFTRRCNTCISVEANAKKAFETLYPEQIKSGKYSFAGLNLDDASNKSIAEELGVGGQTLLVICGNNKVDITDKGFLYAHDLEKMREEIQKAVNDVRPK